MNNNGTRNEENHVNLTPALHCHILHVGTNLRHWGRFLSGHVYHPMTEAESVGRRLWRVNGGFDVSAKPVTQVLAGKPITSGLTDCLNHVRSAAGDVNRCLTGCLTECLTGCLTGCLSGCLSSLAWCLAGYLPCLTTSSMPKAIYSWLDMSVRGR